MWQCLSTSHNALTEDPYARWKFSKVLKQLAGWHSQCHQNQQCGVRVGVPWSPGFGPESESQIWGRLRLRVRTTVLLDCILSHSTTRFWLVYSSCQSCYLKRVLLSCQFVCLYTIVHLLLEEFRISLEESDFGSGVRVQLLLGPELESRGPIFKKILGQT